MPFQRKIVSQFSKMPWKQREWQLLGVGTMPSESPPMTSASRPWKPLPREKPPLISSSTSRKRERGTKPVSVDSSRKRASSSCLKSSERISQEWANSTRSHASWASTVASKTLRNGIERSCSRTSSTSCLIRRERTRGLNSKVIYMVILNSEQKIEILKNRFGELGLPPYARWKEVE